MYQPFHFPTVKCSIQHILTDKGSKIRFVTYIAIAQYYKKHLQSFFDLVIVLFVNIKLKFSGAAALEKKNYPEQKQFLCHTQVTLTSLGSLLFGE